MAYLEEQQTSRVVTYAQGSASTTREYHMHDYTESNDALIALAAFVPDSILVGDLFCVMPEFEITPVFSDPQKTLYVGTVTWKTPEASSGSEETSTDPKEPEDESTFSFSFSSITDVKTHSMEQDTYSTGWAGAKDNQEYGINRQNPELQPEGVEYNKPIVTMTCKVVIAQNVATNEWFKDRLDQVWTLNESTFKSLPPRSVAFTGLAGNQRTDGHWDLTYSFEYRPDNPDQVSFPAGEGKLITVDGTDGWDYLWAEYTKFEQKTNLEDAEPVVKRIIKRIHVTKDIYPTSDFSKLGIVGVENG